MEDWAGRDGDGRRRRVVVGRDAACSNSCAMDLVATAAKGSQVHMSIRCHLITTNCRWCFVLFALFCFFF